MSMKNLRKAIEKSANKRDDFSLGTVIRWRASGRYDYAAIKTVAGWYTTARDFNTFVPQTVDWEELLEILTRSETSDVRVAVEWVDIGPQSGDTEA